MKKNNGASIVISDYAINKFKINSYPVMVVINSKGTINNIINISSYVQIEHILTTYYKEAS